MNFSERAVISVSLLMPPGGTVCVAGFNNVPLYAPLTGQQTDYRIYGLTLKNKVKYIFRVYNSRFHVDNHNKK